MHGRGEVDRQRLQSSPPDSTTGRESERRDSCVCSRTSWPAASNGVRRTRTRERRSQRTPAPWATNCGARRCRADQRVVTATVVVSLSPSRWEVTPKTSSPGPSSRHTSRLVSLSPGLSGAASHDQS